MSQFDRKMKFGSKDVIQTKSADLRGDANQKLTYLHDNNRLLTEKRLLLLWTGPPRYQSTKAPNKPIRSVFCTPSLFGARR